MLFRGENKMAQYSGNLVGVVGTDGTVATGVAANYRRAIAPFSNFGTRQLMFLVVSLTGTNIGTDGSVGTGVDAGVATSDTTNVGGTGEDYAIKDASGNTVVPASYIYASNSHIYAALNGVAIAAEIFMVGSPVFSGSGSSKNILFSVGVYADTAASLNAGQSYAGEQSSGNTAAQTIQTAVTNAVAALGSGAAVTVQPAYLSGNSLTVPGHAY
jgi:hypothetical protein